MGTTNEYQYKGNATLLTEVVQPPGWVIMFVIRSPEYLPHTRPALNHANRRGQRVLGRLAGV